MTAIPDALASDPAAAMRRACTTWMRDPHKLTPCCRKPTLLGFFAGKLIATACPDCDGYWPVTNTQA